MECELIPICDESIPFPSTNEGMEEFESKQSQATLKTYQILIELAKNVDIIHSHGLDLIDFKDYANVTTLHGPITIQKLRYYLERHELNYISISDNQQGACPSLKYVGTVYNGEDPSLFPINTEPEEYLCFLGRFDREKNPHLAIQLALSINMPIKLGGKIDFVGAEYFEDQIRPFLSHPLVEYLGELDLRQKIELLSKAKCNLHPTGFREPFGLSVLEAAYCGTPTLAINKGSMPELIENGRTGMLVEDFVEGYHLIQTCFEMDRSYISSRARSLFNYSKMSEQYATIYRQVIDVHRSNLKAQ